MHSRFSLYRSHLDFVHKLWKEHCRPTDWVIDATCGNGKDSLFLAPLIPQGGLCCIDIQPAALETTKDLLTNFSLETYFFLQSHASFPEMAYSKPISLIVYNLGYLPGGDKRLTTQIQSTLASVQEAQNILQPGGLLTCTLYPGHPEGLEEKNTLLNYFKGKIQKEFNFSHLKWLGSENNPSVLIIQKSY